MIKTSGLSKTFRGGVRAVRGVDLSVDSGEIVGFLGPNGAGKTTTMRMLTTLLRPTAGTATVAGRDLLTDPQGVRRHIGYVSQDGGIGPLNPVGEELELHAMLYGMRPAQARERVAQTLERLELAGLADRAGGALSGGQRRRFDLAFGLVHRPALLFLDEPTTGLDPQSRANLWDHIRRLRDEDGLTVLLSTHYLDEADALADRLVIIDHGAVVAEGTPAEIKGGAGTLDDAFLAITGRSLREDGGTGEPGAAGNGTAAAGTAGKRGAA
ncbi:ATP-binding cassette domain-containing protein [Planomonospora sp. ID67723]|uniref:ABC transporter ATP-binding protein n=1 Tax=Planomonospora sp. ID67723 TaxID=2738134 RepID=UPI0018C3EA52|nr:ATP-binding cassette domain-containing protein [Planomonospora sp. ID67723]MBG0829997.1 ATP-binding cassette domain-containing protein [Planomonospora sp. ID67723]